MRQIEQEKIMVFSLGTTVDGIRQTSREELGDKVSGTNGEDFKPIDQSEWDFFAPYIQYKFPFNFMILTIHNEICSVCLATAGALMETRSFTFFSTDTQKNRHIKKFETTNKMATKTEILHVHFDCVQFNLLSLFQKMWNLCTIRVLWRDKRFFPFHPSMTECCSLRWNLTWNFSALSPPTAKTWPRSKNVEKNYFNLRKVHIKAKTKISAKRRKREEQERRAEQTGKYSFAVLLEFLFI